MNTASKYPDVRPPPDDMARQFEALTNLFCSVLERLGRAEEIIARLSTLAGLEPPVTDPVERTTVKRAAGVLAVSPTRIRQLIRNGELAAIKTHGRVLIDEASLAKLSGERSTERRIGSDDGNT